MDAHLAFLLDLSWRSHVCFFLELGLLSKFSLNSCLPDFPHDFICKKFWGTSSPALWNSIFNLSFVIYLFFNLSAILHRDETQTTIKMMYLHFANLTSTAWNVGYDYFVVNFSHRAATHGILSFIIKHNIWFLAPSLYHSA